MATANTNSEIVESTPFPLQGRRAFVGGASQGIGKAIAQTLASRGASVTLLSRNRESLMDVVGGLNTSAEQRHSIIVGDVENPVDIIDTVHKEINTSGPFHIVINNTAGPAGGQLVNSTVPSLLQAFNNHVLFSHQLMQAVVNTMKVMHHGRFINIISTSVKQPIEGLGVSNVIRGAMASWSKTLATELAPFGITVNNVLPGATETDRLTAIIDRKVAASGNDVDAVTASMLREIPVGRFARPEEIASTVAFLASDEAAYITGTSILVDGGRTKALS